MSGKTIWIQFDVLDRMYFLEFTGEETFGDAVEPIKKDYPGKDLIFVVNNGENISNQQYTTLNKIPSLANADGISKVKVSVPITGGGFARTISAGPTQAQPASRSSATTTLSQPSRSTIPTAKPIPSNSGSVQMPAKPAPAAKPTQKNEDPKKGGKKETVFKFATKKQRKDPNNFEKLIKEVMDVWPHSTQAEVEDALRNNGYNTNNAVFQLMNK